MIQKRKVNNFIPPAAEKKVISYVSGSAKTQGDACISRDVEAGKET